MRETYEKQEKGPADGERYGAPNSNFELWDNDEDALVEEKNADFDHA